MADGCDPRCRSESFWDAYQAWDGDNNELPMSEERAKQIFFEHHHPDCPVLARAIAWGRALMQEGGS